MSKDTNTNPAIHLQKTCNPSSENPKNPNPNTDDKYGYLTFEFVATIVDGSVL